MGPTPDAFAPRAWRQRYVKTKPTKDLTLNIRSLTRGDGVVIGAAVLLFIASFLDFYTIDCGGSSFCKDAGENGWKSDFFPVLPSIFLAGVIAAVLIVSARFQPAGRNLFGLSLDQWGTALAVFAAWSSLWTIIGGPEGVDKGVGQILGLIGTLAMAAVALLIQRVPALKVPLVNASGPAPSPYGAAPQPGYGYPGGAQPGAPAPYGAQPGQPQPGQPQPGQSFGGQPTPGPGTLGRRGLRPVLVRGAGGPPAVRRGRFVEHHRRTGPRHLVPRGGAARSGAGRPDAGRPSRRAAGHHGDPARLSRAEPRVP